MAARAPSNITPDTTIDMTAQPGMEVDDRPTLLVVDDDVTFCTVLANAMTKRGFNVSCAQTVEQALEAAEACTRVCRNRSKAAWCFGIGSG